MPSQSTVGLAILAGVSFGCSATIGDGGADRGGNAVVDGPGGAGDDAGVVIDAPIDARPCTGGDARMTSASGACFFITYAPATFANAKAACEAQAAHLAIVKTAEEDGVVRALVGAMRDAFIGLSDQATEGTFLWVDGSALSYTNWYMGEPNDGNGAYPEDCAVVNGARGGQWDDRPCAPVSGVGGGSYAYVCQF